MLPKQLSHIKTQDFWGWHVMSNFGSLRVGGWGLDKSNLFLHIPQMLNGLGSGEFGDMINTLSSLLGSLGDSIAVFVVWQINSQSTTC